MSRLTTAAAIFCIPVVLSCAARTATVETEREIRERRTAAANHALKAALDSSGFSIGYVRQQLDLGNYKAVEKVYRDVIKQYKKDIVYEARLLTAFDQFRPDNGIPLSRLDSWVESTGSGIAYAARGIFMAQQGFDVRGGKWAQETPRADMNAMVECHYAATVDLMSATEKEPDMAPAYVWWIQIAKASSTPYEPEEILARAVKADKRCYYARFQYIISLQPRWGGSHEQMKAFAEEAAKQSDLNARLWSLQGEVYADIADQYWFAKDYAEASNYYGVALIYGDRTSWLRYRAACFYTLRIYELAIDDLSRVLYYAPENAQAHRLVALAQEALKGK